MTSISLTITIKQENDYTFNRKSTWNLCDIIISEGQKYSLNSMLKGELEEIVNELSIEMKEANDPNN